jgi:molybdopterin-synthase adenylyltransferase
VVKVDAARAALAGVNPDISVAAIHKRVDDFSELVSKADVVLDCTDNFATRHAINRACVKHRKPLVSGAAIRFDGQLMVFDLRMQSAACYACLFSEDAQVEEVQCSTMGVFAPLTGVVGAMQAMIAMKLIVGIGEHSASTVQNFDAKSGEWRTARVPRDAGCAICRQR